MTATDPSSPPGAAPGAAGPSFPADPGNPFVAPYPSNLSVGNVKLSGPEIKDTGDRVMMTIRSGSATVTVFLTREEAEQWAANIAQGARNCSPLVIPR